MKKKACCLPLIAMTLLSLLMAACEHKKQQSFIIGFANIVPDLDQNFIGFKEAMADLGYHEGQNIQYIYNGPTTDMSRLQSEVQTLIEADIDLLFTITTPVTLAAKEATSKNKLPVVFSTVMDPIEAGIVDSLQQPGGNITGVAFGIQEARRFEWFLRIAPEIKNIYVPYNPNDKSPVQALKIIREASAKFGVNLITFEVSNPGMLDEAVLNIPPEADAVFFLPDSLLATRLDDFEASTLKRNLPTSAVNISSVKANNVLTAYGLDQQQSGRQVARLADQIFKGANPADLPVEMSEFFLAINLKVANRIGLTVPDDILSQADIIVR